jgi:hypothetical protein
MSGNRLVVGGLCSVAAVLLLAGCSGGSGSKNSAASDTSAATTSAAPRTTVAESAFCTSATDAFTRLSPAFSGSSGNPAALAPVLQRAEAEIRAIQPPAELAADWTKLADVLHSFAGVYAGLHNQAEASASAFAQRNAQLLGQLTPVATHIQDYVAKNCDLTVPSASTTGAAAPSS